MIRESLQAMMMMSLAELITERVYREAKVPEFNTEQMHQK